MIWRIFLTLSFCLLSGLALANPSGKRIALSYDDAPRGDGRMFTGEARTQALIQQWEVMNTGPVVIFATTRGLGDPPGRERLQDYAEAGHIIANHTHTHPWAGRVSVEDFLAEIDRTEEELEGFPNRRPWFRFPFLDEGGYGEDKEAARLKRDELREGLAERGLRNGYVTVDTFDWHLDSLLQQALRDGRLVDETALSKVYAEMVVDAAEHYDRMALEVLGHRPAHVLLLHENDVAALATDEMVLALKAAGWAIIHPDEAYADETLASDPDTLFAGMGRIASLAKEAGKEGAEYFDHWSADRTGIEARVETETVFGP
ncbi:MAG: polysaccharide deacetylase family protein [Pseudomonadota bacterium]